MVGEVPRQRSVALAAAGADVCVASRGPEGLQETADAIISLGRKGTSFAIADPFAGDRMGIVRDQRECHRPGFHADGNGHVLLVDGGWVAAWRITLCTAPREGVSSAAGRGATWMWGIGACASSKPRVSRTAFCT